MKNSELPPIALRLGGRPRVTALEDERAISVRDEREEERWITMGMDSLARILVVVCTWRDQQIRLISARLATRGETPAILDWFRQQVDLAGGGNYQTLINEALRHFMRQKQESLETTLRRVIRDQLRRAG